MFSEAIKLAGLKNIGRFISIGGSGWGRATGRLPGLLAVLGKLKKPPGKVSSSKPGFCLLDTGRSQLCMLCESLQWGCCLFRFADWWEEALGDASSKQAAKMHLRDGAPAASDMWQVQLWACG